jgi:hypothetical protein
LHPERCGRLRVQETRPGDWRELQANRGGSGDEERGRGGEGKRGTGGGEGAR